MIFHIYVELPEGNRWLIHVYPIISGLQASTILLVVPENLQDSSTVWVPFYLKATAPKFDAISTSQCPATDDTDDFEANVISFNSTMSAFSRSFRCGALLRKIQVGVWDQILDPKKSLDVFGEFQRCRWSPCFFSWFFNDYAGLATVWRGSVFLLDFGLHEISLW